MANMFENLDLGEIIDDDDMMRGLLGMIVSEGKLIKGYYNAPYIWKTFKCAEISARLAWEEDKYAITGIDTHCSGNKVWDVNVQSDITNTNSEPGERKVLVTNSEKHGLAVVNLVNADVLPSFLEGDHIKMQVVGLAEFIEFFDDEDEMSDSIPEPDFGQKILLGEGMIMPTGFFNNHDPENGSCENNELDDINVVRGTIKSIYGGSFDIMEQHFEPFLRFVIDTDFGELEIAAGKDMVRESPKDTIHVGMTVMAGIVISGDVAIYDYEDGKIRDEEHDLRAIRQTICKGEAERIRSILSEYCKYVSCVGKWDVSGRDDVINVFDRVSKAHSWMYVAHMATLGEPRDPDAASELKYKEGKRCLVLENEHNDYESIMFIERDGNGDICSIEVTNDSRYSFYIDISSVHNSEFDLAEKELAPLEDRIWTRAHYLKLIDEGVEYDENNLNEETLAIAEKMLRGFSDEGFENEKDYRRAYKELFGMTFAVAAGHPNDSKYIKVGGTFYNDYKYRNEIKDVTSEIYRSGMIKSLQQISFIGLIYAASQKKDEHDNKNQNHKNGELLQ